MKPILLSRKEWEAVANALRTATLSYEAGANDLLKMGDFRSSDMLTLQAQEADKLYEKIIGVVEEA